MARNKYPELTVEKILEVSKKLFLEKGYDQTTIQDIVDELGGLTKGAIYHHFKSKEEIMNALSAQMFTDNNPFNAVRMREDLNGLQKIQTAMMVNQANDERRELSMQAMPLLENPRILAGMIESNRVNLTPVIKELIEEGQNDGSIHTEYAKELAELFPLLELWMMPSLYPMTGDDMKRKTFFIKEMFEKMGVPLFDKQIVKLINEWYEQVKE